LGDTNSGLIAIGARKHGAEIFHMEAGNRCMDKRVPEELNRKIIDAFSTYNLPYTDNSKENLIREGHDKNHVFKIGNPIREVLKHYEFMINSSQIIGKLGLHHEGYALLTLHRAENVSDYERFSDIAIAINEIAKHIQVVFPMHPTTRDQFAYHELMFSASVKVIEPLGFFDFVKLEKNAKFIITESGTVCEESTIFYKPCIILRDTIERQELIEAGSVVLAGANADDIVRAYKSLNLENEWQIPSDYLKMNVADTVIKILLGK
jgi:UDP-N-acetylglucosamine 2-epimerase (non-hydrolysing)